MVVGAVETKAYNRENGKAKKRSSKIKDWYRGKRSRDGPVKKRKFRLFGAPLSHIMGNVQLPDILQVLHIILSISKVVVSIRDIIHRFFSNMTSYLVNCRSIS